MPLRDNYNHCSVYCILHVIFCHLKAALDQGRYKRLSSKEIVVSRSKSSGVNCQILQLLLKCLYMTSKK